MSDTHHDEHASHGDSNDFLSMVIRALGRLAGKQAASPDSTGALSLALVFVIFLGSVLNLRYDLRYFLLLGLSLLFFKNGWLNIPSGANGTEPSVGLLRILGRRWPVMVKEGWRFVIWILMDYQIISIQKSEVACSTIVNCERDPADGKDEVDAQLRVDIEVTLEPNTHSPDAGQMLINLINSGGIEGAKRILIGPLLSFLKDIAITYQWEVFAALRS